jgi:hypothetical protein
MISGKGEGTQEAQKAQEAPVPFVPLVFLPLCSRFELFQLDLNLDGSLIADILGFVLQRVAPCNFTGFSGIVYLPAVTQRHRGMQFREVNNHIRWMLVQRTLDVGIQDSP